MEAMRPSSSASPRAPAAVAAPGDGDANDDQAGGGQDDALAGGEEDFDADAMRSAVEDIT